MYTWAGNLAMASLLQSLLFTSMMCILGTLSATSKEKALWADNDN